jgi:hypothetical protein
MGISGNWTLALVPRSIRWQGREGVCQSVLESLLLEPAHSRLVSERSYRAVARPISPPNLFRGSMERKTGLRSRDLCCLSSLHKSTCHGGEGVLPRRPASLWLRGTRYGRRNWGTIARRITSLNPIVICRSRTGRPIAIRRATRSANLTQAGRRCAAKHVIVLNGQSPARGRPVYSDLRTGDSLRGNVGGRRRQGQRRRRHHGRYR